MDLNLSPHMPNGVSFLLNRSRAKCKVIQLPSGKLQSHAALWEWCKCYIRKCNLINHEKPFNIYYWFQHLLFCDELGLCNFFSQESQDHLEVRGRVPCRTAVLPHFCLILPFLKSDLWPFILLPREWSYCSI